MTALGDIAFLRPWWFLALPVLALLGIAAWRGARGLGAWQGAIDPPLMAALRRLSRVHEQPGARVLWPLLAVLPVALALTGPASLKRDGLAFRNLDGIVIVMDLSRSVTEHPEFEAAVTAARLVAHGAGSRQVGLIVTAGDAYTASSLTTDARALGGTLALLDAETMPDAGSRTGRGLALAAQTLRDAEIRFGDILLVSDRGGLGEAARGRAAALSGSGIRLSVLYLGEDAAGEARAVADLGAGIAAPVIRPDGAVAALSNSTAARIAEAGYGIVLWRDYGRYLLFLALVPVLALFRGRAA